MGLQQTTEPNQTSPLGSFVSSIQGWTARAAPVMVLLRFKVSRSYRPEFYDCVVKVPSYCCDVLYLIFYWLYPTVLYVHIYIVC